MLVRLCSKSYKIDFSSMWTENFQLYKLGLEKTEEQEIKLPTFIGPERKQGNSRKTSTSLTMLKPLTVWITANCGKFLEMGIPLYLSPEKPICRTRSNRTRHGTTDWFQIGKGVRQGCMLSPCLFNLYAEYIMRNSGLDKTQTRINIAGRNVNNLRYTDDTTLMVESDVRN